MKPCNICAKKKVKFFNRYRQVHYFGEKQWHKIRLLTIRKKDMNCFNICKHCNKPPIMYYLPFGETLMLSKTCFHYDDYSIKRSKKRYSAPKHKYCIRGPAIKNFFGKNIHLFPNGDLYFICKNRYEAIRLLREWNNKLGISPQYILYNHKGEIRNIR